MSEFLQFVNLKENPGEYQADLKMISILINDHEDTIKYLSKSAEECEEEYADAWTNDFIIGLMEIHE